MSSSATTRPITRPSRDPGRSLPRLPPEHVPGALRAGAGFAALFGTLWFVQAALAVGLPALAIAGVAAGVGIVVSLWATRARRPRPPGPVDPDARRAKRWINRATVIQLAVSVPGAVGVQLLVDPTAAIPLVVVTVGVYLLALAPVVGRAHLWLSGALLVVIPLFTLLTADGMARVVVTGLVCGTAFLAKGAVDVLLAVRHRSA